MATDVEMQGISRDLRRQLDDAHISVARKPDALRMVEVEPLPPRLWEQLRQELQAEYRRATGEPNATLTVELTQ